eukprot:1734006-Amphidinium_carterae.1
MEAKGPIDEVESNTMDTILEAAPQPQPNPPEPPEMVDTDAMQDQDRRPYVVHESPTPSAYQYGRRLPHA